MDRERLLDLIVKEFADDLNALEREELSSALEHDAAFRSEYRLLRLYWDRKKSHSAHDKLIYQKVLEKIEKAQPQPIVAIEKRKSPKWKFYGAAAALLLCISIGLYYLNEDKQKGIVREFTTENTNRSIVLADGTKVTLNAASKLIYPVVFDGNKREVSLIGEAYFDVNSDARHPFIIHTAHAHVNVLGTVLNVRAYPDEKKTETTLLQGVVAVSFNDSKHKRILLKPSEKLTIRQDTTLSLSGSQKKAARATVELGNVSFYEPKDTIALETLWLENKLAFKNERFEDIALELERKFDITIEFNSERAKAIKFDAVFEDEAIDQVLKALQLAGPFNYTRSNKHVRIYD